MYKRKITIFSSLLMLLIAATSALVLVSSQVTRSHLDQSVKAQTLLNQHLQLSSISYRLFKQLTDEMIFGNNANQAEVRNKKIIVDATLAKIRTLEWEQRAALGVDATQGSIEDTDALETLINTIIAEFQAILTAGGEQPLVQRQRVQKLLEVTIDNRFREAVNAAVNRQSQMVASLNARIETLNTSIFWYSILLAIMAVPIVVLGSIWLMSVLYQPLSSIRQGAEAIAKGNYDYRMSRGFDAEFDAIAEAFNAMAAQLTKQQQSAEQSKQQLEYLVSERTSELTKTNQLLSQTDQTRREFLADISHELRTPLTIIRGEAQVTLRQTQVSAEDYRETLNSILEQAMALSRLVDDLLLIARADSGSLRLNLQTVFLSAWLPQIQTRFASLLDRHDCELRTDWSATDVQLQADPDRLMQVFGVLFDNAIKYGGNGQSITFGCDVTGPRLVFWVQDQGPGIDAAALPRLFERFYRAGGNKASGVGLGLAIAKAIVEAHDGQIYAQSNNEGARFVIELEAHHG